MAKKNKVVFKRHRFWWGFYRPVVWFISKIRGYKHTNRLKMKKGESYVILSNHQTSMDGVLIGASFSRPFCGLTSDSFFSKGWQAKMFKHQLGIIPMKKGTVDIKANMDMVRCIKEGGSLLIFPEGNRTYAEFQFPFTDGFAKFIRFFKKPIVLFNIHGGNGCYPRFGGKKRKGPYYGEIKRIIKPEEYDKWSDEKLHSVIQEGLKVYDSESGEFFKSKAKAEFLERMLFVCPKCGKIETLSSKGDHLTCSNCGLDIVFNEDLHLTSEDESFTFNKLLDWYNYQIRYVRDFEVTDKVIFTDKNVKLFISNPGKKRKLISDGKILLTKDKLIFESIEFNVADIEIASPINGTNFNFSTNDENYLVMGHERFNPLKYVLMFNRLDTKMKLNKTDIYYTLEERK